MFLLWFRIIRPQTLFASLCPVLVALLTMPEPVSSWITATVTIVCSLSLQILSNLINDYYDFKRGTDKKGRVGFKRALAEGEVSEKMMRNACLLTLLICIGCGAYLVYVGGWVIFAIGLSAILFAWLYTATSHSLSYLGIADIFVFLYYGVIASCGTYYLQTKGWDWPVFYTGAVCGLISMCVLLINNLRDVEDDKAVRKLTLPVRFGVGAGHTLMLCVVLLMPVMAYMAYGWSLPMLVGLPALFLYQRVKKASGIVFNKCLMGAGMINVLFTLLVWIATFLPCR